jgi:hypothetical protein
VTCRLSQCLNHAARFQQDRGVRERLLLSCEVSDGQRTRCAVVELGASNALHLSKDWLCQEGCTGLTDKLVLAFFAYQEVKVRLAGAAEPRDGGASPEVLPQVGYS